MASGGKTHIDSKVVDTLRAAGMKCTRQRALIVRTFFQRNEHVSAEEIFRMVNKGDASVSKATVYNTLGLLARKGLVREVMANPDRMFYDPNVQPHYHIYDAESGELTDIDEGDVHLARLPPLPSGSELQGVDIIIRIRKTTS